MVFSDLIEGDKLRAPKSWSKKLRSNQTLTATPPDKVVELVSEILVQKIKADLTDEREHHQKDTLEEVWRPR